MNEVNNVLNEAPPISIALESELVDASSRDNSVKRFREAGIRLPTFSELRDPSTIDPSIVADLASVDRNVADARNLFRVHWHNKWDQEGFADVPEHVVLPKAITGVDAKIVLAFGDRFPMITAHKVLAAYACLAPRIVTGTFDPTRHKAIWPSTGNYARGGVAISRIMQSHGLAVLPAGMSQERFDWLNAWTLDPSTDIIRTPGTESNVKEIYDACTELSKDPSNMVINQFCEFANYLGHRTITGPSMAKIFEHIKGTAGQLKGFVSATGSAGTIAAGDHLKEVYGSEIVAAEALECPTMLENGFGEHNIQGIGDKHIPLIHNVHNTDVVTSISDKVTNHLDVLFQTEVGRNYLTSELGIDEELVHRLQHMGYSSWCNMVSAIAFAQLRDLGDDDVVLTIATDGAAMYHSGRQPIIDADFGGSFTTADAEATFATHLSDPGVHTVLDLDDRGRNRIFNLGYFTWVEQLGLDIETFTARRDQSWWDDLVPKVAAWDELILDFNEQTGLG